MRRSIPIALVAALTFGLVGAAPAPAPDPAPDVAGPTSVTSDAAAASGLLGGLVGGLVGGVVEGTLGLVGGVVHTVLDGVTGTLRTVACERPFELVEGIGCARTTGDGMVEHVGPDGAVATTHGHDAGHDAQHVEGGASGTLPSKRRPLLCTGNGGYRTVVLYAHLGGSADRRSTHLSTIRQTMERSNQAVAASAARSGGPLADLRAKCTSGGAVSVSTLRVGSRHFADIKAAAAAAGFNRPNEKYLIFGDFDSPRAGVGGIADMFLDDRRTTANHNNGTRAMYGLVYGARHFTGSIALHELSHTMGAVQPKAPQADGFGHCKVNADVLCYPSSSTRCGSLVFDCGNDSYFSTNTRSGQWLHSRWNLGWSGHRFIRVAATTQQQPRSTDPFSDIARSSHRQDIITVAARGIAKGFADGTFRPNATVTRGQMASFVNRGRPFPAASSHPFSDLRGSSHERDVAALARGRVVRGYQDGTYRPRAVVTRGQMASFIARAFELPTARTHGFSDVRRTSHEADIAAVAAAGIAKGFSDGTYRPSAPLTRGQAATMIVRATRR